MAEDLYDHKLCKSSYNTELIERLKDYGKKRPQMCSLKEINQAGEHTYILKKSALSIRLMSPHSEASRKKKAENIRENRKYRKESSYEKGNVF